MHQLFNTGPRPGNSQLLQQRAQLHNHRDLACGKIRANADRRNQRQRHKHVRLDVKARHKPDDRLQKNRDAAQDDRHPGNVKRKRLHARQTANDRGAGENQQDNFLFCPAKFKQALQSFH